MIASLPFNMSLQINRCFEFQLSRVSLVPCFAFGENDLYDQIDNPEGSLLKFLQKRLTKVFGFSMPLFRGRGVFNYTFGVLPRRRPITTVSKYIFQVLVSILITENEKINVSILIVCIGRVY